MQGDLFYAVGFIGGGYNRAYAKRRHHSQKSIEIALISGGMEVFGTLLGFFAVSFATAIMPFALAFAGGSMMYIIIDEMIPQTHIVKFGSKASFATLGGFCIILVLDAVLGMI